MSLGPEATVFRGRVVIPGSGTGIALPERTRRDIAAAVARVGAQARLMLLQRRGSGEPPRGHLLVAATGEEVEAVRGPVRVMRQLEFYGTFHGPVVRLALSVYPEDGREPLSAGVIVNPSRVRGEVALASLGYQESLYLHLYAVEEADLAYSFSKELSNPEQRRGEAREVLTKTREAYDATPFDRRSFDRAARLAGRNFELPVPDPEDAPGG